jgi:hypothetical protein
MYLPLPLTTPLLVGGFISHLVRKSTKNAALAEKRVNRGTLVASGFIAGGALVGILLAVLKLAGLDHFISWGIPLVLDGGRWVDGTALPWYGAYGEVISLAAFVILLYVLYRTAKKAKD